MGKEEFGFTSGISPDDAMKNVLGSHPEKYGVTYAMVYLPDPNDDPNSDFSLEWGTSNG